MKKRISTSSRSVGKRLFISLLSILLITACTTTSYTYVTTPVDLAYTFELVDFQNPYLVKAFPSTSVDSSRFLVLNKDNLYAIFDTKNYLLSTVTMGPTNLYGFPGEQNLLPQSAFAVPFTGYFLISSSVVGRGITRLDVNSGSFLSVFGGCDADEVISLLEPLDNNYFVSGKRLSLRSVSSGSRLGYLQAQDIYAFTLFKRITATQVVAHNSYELTTSLYDVQAGGPQYLVLQSTIGQFTNIGVRSIAVLSSINIVVICIQTNTCDGVDLSSRTTKWTFSYTALSITDPNLIATHAANDFLVYSNKELEKIYHMSGATNPSVGVATAPTNGAEFLLNGEIVSADLFPNDSYAVFLTPTMLRLLWRKDTICHSSCATCSAPGASMCTSCGTKYDPSWSSGSGPGTCIPQSCHFKCATCFGSGASKCTSCPAGSALVSNHCNPYLASQIVITPSPISQACFKAFKVFDTSSNSCIDCSTKTAFSAKKTLCTTGNQVRYLDWKATLEIDSGNHPIIRLEILDPSVQFSNTNFSILPKTLSDRFSITTNDLQVNPEIRSSNDLIVFTGIDTTNYYKNNVVEYTITSIPTIASQVVFSNSWQAMVLVQKTEVLRSLIIPQNGEPQPPSPVGQSPLPDSASTNSSDSPPTQQVSPTIYKVGTAAAKVTQVFLQVSGGLALGSSLCSLNIGPAFIKLFQIIEVMGKLYFFPVQYSPLLEFVLAKMFSLSDLLNLDKNTLLKENSSYPNKSNGKITKAHEPRHILRSIGGEVLIYLFIATVYCIICLALPVKKNQWQKAVKEVVWFWVMFCLEMSIVDFSFNASYSLGGYWSFSLLTDPWFLVNKVISILILSHSTYESLSLWTTAFDYHNIEPQKPSSHHHTSPKDSITLSYIKEGLEPSSLSSLPTRLINPQFHSRLILSQIVLATLQYSPVLCIVVMTLLVLLPSCHLIYSMCTHWPFPGSILAVQRLSFEAALLCHAVVAVMNYCSVWVPFMDYLLLALISIGLLSQFLAVISSILSSLQKLCKRREVKRKVTTVLRMEKDRSKSKLIERPNIDRRTIKNLGMGTTKTTLSSLQRGSSELLSSCFHNSPSRQCPVQPIENLKTGKLIRRTYNESDFKLLGGSHIFSFRQKLIIGTQNSTPPTLPLPKQSLVDLPASRLLRRPSAIKTHRVITSYKAE